jgi:hypothetical protein
MKRKNYENCVVANMYTVFWFNKQNEFDINNPLQEVSSCFLKAALKLFKKLSNFCAG